MKRLITVILYAALVLVACMPVRADPRPDLATAQTAGERVFDGLAVRLEQILSGLEREDLSDEALKRLSSDLQDVQLEVAEEVAQIQPQLDELDARLTELGPEPEKGAPPEASSVTAQRAALTDEKAPLESALKQAGVITIQADQIDKTITARQRDNFTERLSVRSQSVISPQLWRDFFDHLPPIGASLHLLLSDSLAHLATHFDLKSAGLVLASLLIVAGLWRLLSRFLNRFTGTYDEDIEVPPDVKAGAALVRLIRGGILPALAVFTPYLVLRLAGLLPNRTGELLDVVMSAIFLILVFRGLAQSYFAARRPAWRIIPLETHHALKLTSLIVLLATVTAADRVTARIGEITAAPVAFEAAMSGLSAITTGIILLIILRLFARARQAAQTPPSENLLLRWPVLRVFAWIATAVIILSALFGFLALANFVALQIVGAILIIAMFRLIVMAVKRGITGAAEPGGTVSAFAVRELGIAESTVHQIGILVGGIVQVALVALAAVLIMLPWGFDAQKWIGWLRGALFGFKIGNVTIAPIAVIAAIAVFFVFLVFTRALRGWMEHTYLPSTRLDPGLQNSISTAIGYAGLIIAGGFAVSYAGIDLSNFAIIAGALSVGIGFGLQSIVSNFVSGLILLAERPIKAGDWIVVGNEQGTVRKISVRATEIETFDRASVLIPNSDLVTGQVMNWTHANTLGRVIVAVGVSYDSDPEQVRDLLMAIITDHPSVLSFPEPRVHFLDFGASSLDFRVQGFIKDVNMSLGVRSELRYEIFKRFNDAGIEFPFPQSDLHVRSISSDAAGLFTRPSEAIAPAEPLETADPDREDVS